MNAEKRSATFWQINDNVDPLHSGCYRAGSTPVHSVIFDECKISGCKWMHYVTPKCNVPEHDMHSNCSSPSSYQ